LLARSTGEGITKQVVAGLLLSSLGVFLIIRSRPGGLGFPPSLHDLAGDLLTLCSAVLWALYTIKAKPLLNKYSAIKVTAYCMAAGTSMLLPVSAYELLYQQSWSAISARSWAALAFSAFISGGLAFTLWYQGVKRSGVTRTIVYHYLVPLVAVLFAALFLGERITVTQILGGLAVLAGVYVVQQREENPQ
jgi:drug/metabolite transporter (DMT)-like permease